MGGRKKYLPFSYESKVYSTPSCGRKYTYIWCVKEEYTYDVWKEKNTYLSGEKKIYLPHRGERKIFLPIICGGKILTFQWSKENIFTSDEWKEEILTSQWWKEHVWKEKYLPVSGGNTYLWNVEGKYTYIWRRMRNIVTYNVCKGKILAYW